MKKNPQ